MSDKTLSPREEILVAELMTGKSAQDACLAAGWSAKYARKNGYEIVKRPHIEAELQRRQAALKERSQWTAEKLLEKFENAYDKAEASGQTMAMVRAGEAIGKLTGLMQDKLKLEVEAKPSLTEAIAAGKARAFSHQPASRLIDVTPREAEPQVLASEIFKD